MDAEYFADGLPDLVEAGAEISPEAIAGAIEDLYDGKIDPDSELHASVYTETKRIFREALAEGVSNALDEGSDMPDNDFLSSMAKNADVFSAFRTHKMQQDMAAMLFDGNGRLRSFSQFAKQAQQYASHRNKAWLRTEYNTAVNRAHFATRWRQFEAEKDVLPNLEWIPSTSPNPGADHRVFWGTIRPVNDRFWNEHRPGDRWNCKCELRSTDKPATATPYSDSPKDAPAKGLKTNPGKKGEIFDKQHSYYPDSCTACPFAKNRLRALFADLAGRRNCESCKALARTIDQTGQEPKIVKEFDNGGKLAIYPTVERNKSDYKDLVTIGRFFAEKGNNVVLTPRVHIKSPMYEKIYGDLIGTRYERKCPDLKINGKFYEYESFEKPWKKQKVGRMLSHALKQSNRIIIDNNKGCSLRYFRKLIYGRINSGSDIKEVWIYEKGKCSLIYKQQGD